MYVQVVIIGINVRYLEMPLRNSLYQYGKILITLLN
jgi:hypothetical protein